MAAVVFKTWYTPSASRNMLINRMMEDWASQQAEPVSSCSTVTARSRAS